MPEVILPEERSPFQARIAELEAALAEALDIAEWEASESRGKRSHPERLRQLRRVLAGKVPLS